MKHHFKKLGGVLLFIFFLAGCSNLVCHPLLGADRSPNFVIVLGDNLGKDWFGCYGADGNHTPNIDRLASHGLRFEHCYATALCSTTRAQLLTGRYGFRTGWHTHHDAGIYGGGGFDWKRETTWAKALQKTGYATAITGKWQINDLYAEPQALREHGFDEHLVWTGALVGEGDGHARWQASIAPGGNRELESRYWDPIVFHNEKHVKVDGKFGPDIFLDELMGFMNRNRDQPFVAFYSCPLTHIPTVTTPHSLDPKASEREQFIGMVRYFDFQVDRLAKEIERLGISDNTFLIVLTDNGSSRRISGTKDGKSIVGGLGTLSENGLDVPLVVYNPAHIPLGRVSSTLVDVSDIFPTLMELAGNTIPPDVVLDGRSFAAECGGKSASGQPRDWIFSQYSTTRVLRDRRFKLYSTGSFYDVEEDPEEKHNLAMDESGEIKNAKERLQGILASLPSDTNLPFRYRSSSAFQIEEKSRR